MTPALSLPISGKSIFNKRHIFVAQRVGYYEVVLSVTEGAKTALGWWSRPTCTIPVYAVVLTRPWTDSRWAGTWRTRWETWNSLHTNGKAPPLETLPAIVGRDEIQEMGVYQGGLEWVNIQNLQPEMAFLSWHLWHAERRVGVRGWRWVCLVFGPHLWQVLVIIAPCPI